MRALWAELQKLVIASPQPALTLTLSQRERGPNMILLIDNYDSFVYNLARYFERLGHATRVVRNTAIRADEVERLAPAAIVLSPGPRTPQQAGCSLELVRRLHARVPMLGICLGHQTIAAALGGRIVRAKEPVHGRTSLVHHNGRGVFAGLPNPLIGCRYHSLVVDEASLPDCLEVTARTDDGTIMAIQHRHVAGGRIAVPPGVDLDRLRLSAFGGLSANGGACHAGGIARKRTISVAAGSYDERVIVPEQRIDRYSNVELLLGAATGGDGQTLPLCRSRPIAPRWHRPGHWRRRAEPVSRHWLSGGKISDVPPTSVAITGTPAAAASNSTRPSGSCRAGCTSRVNSPSSRQTSLRTPRK